MPRLTPNDDFQRTLAAIGGGLPKLKYLAELRHDGLRHRHWGMEHVYGPEKSQAAMQFAHDALLRHVLTTPIRLLLGDAERWLEEDKQSASKYLGSWREYLSASASTQINSASKKHLKSVFVALSLLLKIPDAAQKNS
jgi:hypothetical protein